MKVSSFVLRCNCAFEAVMAQPELTAQICKMRSTVLQLRHAGRSGCGMDLPETDRSVPLPGPGKPGQRPDGAWQKAGMAVILV